MNERQPGGEQSGAGEHERLLESLRELIRSEGLPQAAELLDVSTRTLQRTLASGRLTVRMRDALELRRLSEGGEAVKTRLEDTGDLQQRLERLEGSFEALARELRDARADKPVSTKRDTEPSAGTAPPPAGRSAPTNIIGGPAVTRPRRSYAQLVTLGPEAGEELVYGKAMPLIAEWRRARVDHLDKGKGRVERATAWVRMRKLEVALIGEHDLTLPPAVYPWTRMERAREVWRREQSLGDARAERRRALLWRWVRRLVTLGICRH